MSRRSLRSYNAEAYRTVAAVFRSGDVQRGLWLAELEIRSAIRWLHWAGDRQRAVLEAAYSPRGYRQSATLHVNRAARHLGRLIELRAHYVPELP